MPQKDTLEFLNELARKQVGFHVTHDVPGGQRTIDLSAGEVAEYLRDPASALAKHFGVPKDVYVGWQQSEYKVLCAGFTNKGSRCRNTVPGLFDTKTPKEWWEGQGGYCSVHI